MYPDDFSKLPTGELRKYINSEDDVLSQRATDELIRRGKKLTEEIKETRNSLHSVIPSTLPLVTTI